MTREEATIICLRGHIEALEETITDLEETIKTLEQKPILDQIRAEIQNNNIFDFIEVQTALDIIDKYRKETEQCLTKTITNP